MIDREKMGLPFRPFLYTLDQIQDMLMVNDLNPMLHFDKRSTGIHHNEHLKAINLAPEGCTPEWRVEEAELLRWMQFKGFHILRRSTRRR